SFFIRYFANARLTLYPLAGAQGGAARLLCFSSREAAADPIPPTPATATTALAGDPGSSARLARMMTTPRTAKSALLGDPARKRALVYGAFGMTNLANGTALSLGSQAPKM